MDSSSVMILAGAVGTFLLREVYDFFKGRLSKSEREKEEALKDSTKAIAQLTMAVLKLEVKMDETFRRLDEIPEIKKDVNELHSKVRAMGHAK